MTTSGIELKDHTHSEDQLSPSIALQTSTNDSIVLLKPHEGSVVHDDKKQVLIKLRNVVFLALIFMTLEIIGGLLADSIAILSDAAHMLSDLLSFAISIISVYISTFPPNSRNSFGYHRAGVVGALASVVLIWVLTAFLVYYAIDRIFNLHTVDLDAGIMLGTSIIGLGMNLVMVKVLHGSGHGHDCGHSHGHGHSHAHSHSHSHLEGTECSHDHGEHHHHASETPQDYAPPVHGEGGSSHAHTHNHGSHKHSQFSNYRKESGHQHGAGHEHNPHKHSKKPPSIRISPNKRYGRGEFDSPVQRLIASSPAETQNKSSPPNDKANLSTDKTETSLTDQALTGSNSQRENIDAGHTHQHHDRHEHHDHHDHTHKEHHHHDHDHSHGHSHTHTHSHSKSKSKSHSHHDHDHDHHDHEEDLNIRAAMIHIIGDILQSIGVIIASVVIMFNPERFKIIDPILTIIFSIIVLFTTKKILGDCLNVIMQSTPVHIDADEIKRLIEAVPNVKSVHNLHIWSLTTGKPVLSAHVFADGDLSEVLAKVTKVCRKERIKHTTIQIEYIHDEEHQSFINCDHGIC